MTTEAPARHSMSETGNGYNHGRFHPRLFAEDVRMAAHPRGATTGEMAPSFELADTEGTNWRLEDLRGQPVVLITGSASCPLTHGSAPALKEVYRDFADRSHWFYLYVREAHPGENLPAHGSYQQKRQQADYLKSADAIPWPVLVDDVDGSVAREYTELPNAVFIIDGAGWIVFRGAVAHGPTLRSALTELLDTGRVEHADDKLPHMLGPMTYGWEAIERSGHMATRDMWRGAPPMAANLWLGNQARPLLSPLARRSRPIPAGVKLAAGLVVAALLLRRRRAGD